LARKRKTDHRGDVSAVMAFEQYYQSRFVERWQPLRESLLKPPQHVALTDSLKTIYYLDEASVAAAQALPLEPGNRIVDLCAAPGGKTLVLAGRLPPNASLISNERSSARRARLHRVLDEHLSEPLRARVTITGHDATRWGVVQPLSCDRILLDVPCSSERHVITDPAHLARWSASRSQRLAIQAFAMLAAAIDALVPGGMVLYVTCALTSTENDDVIAKAFRKREGLVSTIPTDLPWGELTRYGVHVLPDAAEGRGPLYVCLLKKAETEGGVPVDSRSGFA
jgi:5-methylcytosine rRNA methyltransferase NSUN4